MENEDSKTAVNSLVKGITTYIDSKFKKMPYVTTDLGTIESVVLDGRMYSHTVKIRNSSYSGIKSVGNIKFSENSIVYVFIPNGQYSNMFILGMLDNTEANIVGGTINIGNGNFTVDSEGNLTTKTGYIGNGSNGFTISDNAIYNGRSTLRGGSWTNDDGIYIGTDGISLQGANQSSNWRERIIFTFNGLTFYQPNQISGATTISMSTNDGISYILNGRMGGDGVEWGHKLEMNQGASTFQVYKKNTSLDITDYNFEVDSVNKVFNLVNFDIKANSDSSAEEEDRYNIEFKKNNRTIHLDNVSAYLTNGYRAIVYDYINETDIENGSISIQMFNQHPHIIGTWMYNKLDNFGLELDNGDVNVVSGDIYCSNGEVMCGSLSVIGQKNRIVATKNYGKRALNAVESAEAYFSDMGTAICDNNGIAEVPFEAIFAETVDLTKDYNIQITQLTENAGWVEKHTDKFIIHSKPNAKFDWIVHCKQRDYSNIRLEEREVKI